jgi:hypothetical protein
MIYSFYGRRLLTGVVFCQACARTSSTHPGTPIVYDENYTTLSVGRLGLHRTRHLLSDLAADPELAHNLMKTRKWENPPLPKR